VHTLVTVLTAPLTFVIHRYAVEREWRDVRSSPALERVDLHVILASCP